MSVWESMGSMEGVDIEVFRRVAPAKKRVPKTRKETNRPLEFYRGKQRSEEENLKKYKKQKLLKELDILYFEIDQRFSKIDQLFEEIKKL